MKSDVKKSLLRQSWRDIQERLKTQGVKSRNTFFMRFTIYILVLVALIILILPGTTNHVLKKYTGIEAPNIMEEGEKTIYNPPIYDPIAAAQQVQKSASQKGPDPRFAKIQVINFIDQKNIPAGSEAIAKLVSGGSNGLIKAELTEDLKFDGNTYLARKTVLIGQGSSANDRLFISFTKAIQPGGKLQKIAAQGFDANDRLVGLKGKKVSDYAFKIAASSGLIFLGAMAENMHSDNGSGFLQPKRKSIKDAALDGVAASAAEQGKRYIDSMDNQNKVEVGFDSSLIVIFDEVENGK